MAGETVELSLDCLEQLLTSVGYDKFRRDDENRALVLDIRGDHVLLRLHVIAGGPRTQTPWYLRMLSYALDFHPRERGLSREWLFEWMNQKNADVIFGRYYYLEDVDVLAFEVAVPCNRGIVEEDFKDALSAATYSVDLAHLELTLGAEGASQR